MKIIRIVILSLILFNLPALALFTISPSLGSLLSYTTIGMLAFYYLLEKKTTPNWWIIILALFYFTISSFQYYYEAKFFFNDIIKYFVFVIGGYELVKRVSKETLFLFILIGTLSIAFEAVFINSPYGRYSGFYLNPNEAGFMCISGYSLVYSLKNTSLKLIGQFVFTLMGLLTFSRTFIVIWILLNLLSLKISIKNIRFLGIGMLIFSTLIIIDQAVGLNNPRFEQLKHILNNEKVSTQEINDDSRMSTWAQFYDKIFESPFFGSGYGTFTGGTGELGVHNSYLMIIGEAGIIPFAIFIAYFGHLFYWSIYFFKKTPYLIMQTIALSMFLLTDHNFFHLYHVVLVTMWIQYQIVIQKNLLLAEDDSTQNSLIESDSNIEQIVQE